MQTANIMLAIGGGRDNTIPKYGVTAAEAAVLRAIHGEDAVFDVEPLADEATGEEGSRSNRQERQRLYAVYGAALDGNGNKIVEGLFPGAAARVFENFDELDLPEEYFKATGRVSADTPVKKTAAKKATAKKTEPEPVPEAAPEDGQNEEDEIGAMPDQSLFE